MLFIYLSFCSLFPQSVIRCLFCIWANVRFVLALPQSVFQSTFSRLTSVAIILSTISKPFYTSLLSKRFLWGLCVFRFLASRMLGRKQFFRCLSDFALSSTAIKRIKPHRNSCYAGYIVGRVFLFFAEAMIVYIRKVFTLTSFVLGKDALVIPMMINW